LFSCQSRIQPLDEKKHLQPEFWRSFSDSKGCEKLSLYAWNASGTVGLEVTALNIPVSASEEFLLDVAARDVVILVETGADIPKNFCVHEIQQIPVAYVYEGISGFVRMNIRYGEAGKPQKASVQLEDVVVVEPKTKKQITINGLNLGMLDLWKRR